MLTFNVILGSEVVQIPTTRADSGKISVEESGGGTVEVGKAELSQEQLQIHSKEKIKTDASEETSTKKYVPAWLS